MTINFYYMPESPPCRAVEMVAGIIGVELTKHYINLSNGDHLSDEYIRLNPLHKVPFIIDADLKLNESRAIMSYLVNKYKPDNEHLYPKDPKIRAKIDELLYYEVGTFYPAASRLLKPMLLGPVKELSKEDEKVFKDSLNYLEKRLAGNHACRFMTSNHLSIADISLAASFSFVAACNYDLHDYKQIAAYLERLKAAIPNYAKVNDSAFENMKKYIESKQKV